MSKQQVQDFTTWVYRSIIGILLSVTLFFAKNTYGEFSEMRKEHTQLLIDMAELKRETSRNSASINTITASLTLPTDFKPLK